LRKNDYTHYNRLANSGFGHSWTPSPPLPSPPLFPFPSTPSFPFPGGPHPLNKPGVLRERCKLSQWGLGRSPSQQTVWCISQPKGAVLVATAFVHFHKNKFIYKNKTQVKSCMTHTHNTKYNTLISEQPRIYVITFPDKMSLARVTGHRGSIPGRSRPFRDG